MLSCIKFNDPQRAFAINNFLAAILIFSRLVFSLTFTMLSFNIRLTHEFEYNSYICNIKLKAIIPMQYQIKRFSRNKNRKSLLHVEYNSYICNNK
nr:MAG TPA: hypothetical protein [Caudoviricetes sp.]